MCLADLKLPPDYTAMQVVAVHAYFLTYGKKFIQQWDKQGSQNLWGPHAPDDPDLLRPK